MPDRLIDTSIWIQHLRGVSAAQSFFVRARAEGRVATSVINAMEVLIGARDRRERSDLEKLLRSSEVVSLDAEDGWQAARIVQAYSASLGTGILDALIAATAIREGLTLVTLNERHFRGIVGLRIEKPF